MATSFTESRSQTRGQLHFILNKSFAVLISPAPDMIDDKLKKITAESSGARSQVELKGKKARSKVRRAKIMSRENGFERDEEWEKWHGMRSQSRVK